MTSASLLLAACRAAVVPVSIRVHPLTYFAFLSLMRDRGMRLSPYASVSSVTGVGHATLVVDSTSKYDRRGWYVETGRYDRRRSQRREAAR